MQRAFGGLHLIVLVAVAVTSEKFVPTAAVMRPAQELRDFEFDGLLEHELSPESNGLGERSKASGHAEELLFKDLAGQLAFHGCRSFSVEPRQ